MNPVVAVIAPGMMGAAVAGRLIESGLKVLTSLTGRSADTMARAKKYGLTQLANLSQLPVTGAILIAAPLPIVRGSGSPARVLALVSR